MTKDRRRLGLLKAGALQGAILSSAGFASIATDKSGVIHLFNAGAKRMLGYTGAEVVGKLTPADLTDPLEAIERAGALSLEFATAVLPGFEALVFKASRGIADQCELTCIRKDGSRFPALISVTALHDVQGAVVGYLLIVTDHTARKEAEERLRRADEGFRRMVESVTDCAIVQLDAQGRVLSWNTGAQIIDGYSAQEIAGQHVSCLYSSEDVEHGVPQRDLDAAAATGRCQTLGWRARKDGSAYRTNTVLTSIHDEAGVLRGFARLAWDLAREEGAAAPARATEEPDATLRPRGVNAVSRCRLLYVEDNPASLGFVEQLIARRTDLLLLRAADANAGIELARTERPEVILMNIDLPGVSAIQFLKLLRADPATENAPFLALSANGASDAISQGLEAGFFHYLTKPMQAEPFMQALGEALEFAARERAEESDRAFTSAHSQ